MGFSTTTIPVSRAFQLCQMHKGEVVAASKELYFNLGLPSYGVVESVKIKDDNVTFFFSLKTGGWVEYKIKRDVTVKET